MVIFVCLIVDEGTGRMQDRSDAGQVILQDKSGAVIGRMLNRKDEGQDKGRTVWMQETLISF